MPRTPIRGRGACDESGRRGDTLGDGTSRGQDVGKALTPAERQPETEVAARRTSAGQQQVAEPRQPHHCLRASPQRHGQPRQFGQAARDQGGTGVLAETRADHRAGRDGDHVLGRAADLRADRVVVAVEPEGRCAEQRGDRRAQAGVAGRDDRGGGQSGGDLVGEVRAGEYGGRCAGSDVGGDLQRQAQRCLLHALGADHQRRETDRKAPQHAAQMLRGHRQQYRIGRIGHR